ncbi:hypothetical protein [Bacillus cereus group sp. BfR-BA-01448]|uniref:hypothetical protein n=1 Tax=Bacillus cereus group sp. BfR-BA-01448 TaxID=2920352 RepID=UPI001F560844|nr:hypothetical protein [Bacillus cereus group sp. BfR-BA-01448]
MNGFDFISLMEFLMTVLPPGILTTVVVPAIALVAVGLALRYSWAQVKSVELDNDKKRLENKLLEHKLLQSSNKTNGTNAVTNAPHANH